MPDEVRYEVAPDGDLIIHVPMQWKKSSRRTLAVAPDAPTTDTPLAKAVGRALALHEEFERVDYPTLRAMAMAHGIDPDCVTHASNLALVSPRILKAIATGRGLPPDLSLRRLRGLRSLVWEEQERELGFAPA